MDAALILAKSREHEILRANLHSQVGTLRVKHQIVVDLLKKVQPKKKFWLWRLFLFIFCGGGKKS
jgi:hypothetical protein